MKRLKEYYNQQIVSELMKELNLENRFQVPKINKISINVGIGKIKEKPGMTNLIANDLYLITGQKPVLKKSNKAISGFKLRIGDIVGLSVTLRGKKMYEFLEKLLKVSIPRIRDFRGFSQKSFDKNFNYTIGIKENIIFPEINYEKIEDIYGLQITFNIKSNSQKESLLLIQKLGFPIK